MWNVMSIKRLLHNSITMSCVLMLSLTIAPYAISGEEKSFSARKDPANVEVLPRAFAHNDYQHPRPLFSALDRGFLFVEADLFLRDDKLYVAHTSSGIESGRTLTNLYLDPLADRVKNSVGSTRTTVDSSG